MFSTGRDLQQAARRRGLRLGGLSPLVVVVAAQREAILAPVLVGAGATLVPEPLAQKAARLGAVVAAPCPPITRRVVLARRPGPLARAAERFVELALR